MKLMNVNEEIRRAFANKYLKWGILLEDSLIDSAGAHVINKKEWEIRFIECNDEDGLCLEFYAISPEHPDEHFKIYQSGDMKTCETIKDGYSYNEYLPEQEKVEKQAFIEKNKKIYEYLKDTGLYRKS